MKSTLHIHGLGAHTPAIQLTNAHIAHFVDTDDAWIVTRTGIHTRHQLAPSENNSDMAIAAAAKALDESGLSVADITHVVVATCTPDAPIPNMACLVSAQLGLHEAMAFDINAACSGFLYGLDIVRGFAADPDARILFIASEALTRRINWQDRSTCVLFGDGAAAVVVSSQSKGSIATLEGLLCRADGSHASLLTMGGGSSTLIKQGDTIDDSFFIQMRGNEVFKFAVRTMSQACKDLLAKHGLSMQDVDLFVPHQANLRIIEAVGARLNAPADKVFMNVMHMGNTSAASIPLALAEARQTGVLHKGMRVLLATFGGGFTWGAALLRF